MHIANSSSTAPKFPLVPVRGRTGRGWVIALSLLLGAGPFHAQAAETLVANEPELRAAIIIGILRFTAWQPPTAGDLRLCILGLPVSAPALLSLPEDTRIGTQALHTRAVDARAARMSECDIVVMGPGQDAASAKVTLQEANHQGVLTICDGCGHHAEYSMVTLTRHEGRIGFEIDTQIAQTNGLQFSSDLLELAVRVRP
ncbi:MAG: YfiR family protein [Gammaproteobacteria bacterium]